MKNHNTPAPSKLVTRFDKELMKLLMEDLKSFKAKYPDNIRKVGAQHLRAA